MNAPFILNAMSRQSHVSKRLKSSLGFLHALHFNYLILYVVEDRFLVVKRTISQNSHHSVYVCPTTLKSPFITVKIWYGMYIEERLMDARLQQTLVRSVGIYKTLTCKIQNSKYLFSARKWNRRILLSSKYNTMKCL